MRGRRNLLWGLIAVSVAAILLLLTLDVLPAGVEDILTRSWSIVLVLVGLSLFLRNRVPASGIVAVVISGILVAGVAAAAYSTRSGQQREDNIQPIIQVVSSDVSLLQINLEILTTDVEIALADDPGMIDGQFSGGRASLIELDYVEDNAGLAVLTVRETKPEAFAPLEWVGRGKIMLELPPGIPLDLAVASTSGDAVLNLGGMSLERLNLDLQSGDALVTLPEYEPRSDSVRANPGTLRVRSGDLTLFIPQIVASRFEIEPGSRSAPEFDTNLYEYIGGVLLENRNFATAEIVIRYIVAAPAGLIRVQTTP